MRSRPSSPMAARSPRQQGGELRRVRRASGSACTPGPQRVDEEVELDVARALAPQRAVVVEAGHPVLDRAPSVHVVEERHDGVAGRARSPGGEQVEGGHGAVRSRAGAGSADAPEADVAHPGVDHLRPPGRRPVAQAVGVGAQVRAALDHLAARPGTAAGPGRSSAPGRRRGGSPARSRACPTSSGCRWSTSRRSTPRRCPPCRRARSRWRGSCPTGAVRDEPALPGAAPREVGAVPGVRHDPAARVAASSPQVYAVPSRPPRAAYSHSASVGRSAPTHAAYAAASSWATWTTGWSGRRFTELPGPSGLRQQAPGVQVHHWLRWRRSTGPRGRGEHQRARAPGSPAARPG